MSSIVLSGDTSGTITLDAPAVAGTNTILFPANTGTVITTASGGQVIPKAALPTGSVLQVINSVKTSVQSTTSTSYVDITDLSVTITPTSSTSKILVLARINNISDSNAGGGYINLVRGSTTIVSSTGGGLANTFSAWATGGGGGMTNNDRKINSCALEYLDSPATTTATTYKMQMRANGTTITVNQWALNTDIASVSSITVMEISA